MTDKEKIERAAYTYVRSNDCCVMDTNVDHEDSFKAGVAWRDSNSPERPTQGQMIMEAANNGFALGQALSQKRIEKLRDALDYYASGSHFTKDEGETNPCKYGYDDSVYIEIHDEGGTAQDALNEDDQNSIVSMEGK